MAKIPDKIICRPRKQRSAEAQAAWGRNSAGPMKDKREARKQTKNWQQFLVEK